MTKNGVRQALLPFRHRGGGLSRGCGAGLQREIIVSQGAIPKISSTLPESGIYNEIPIAISFDQYVMGFTASDLVVTNGTVTNFSGSGYSYSARIVPVTDGWVTVSLPDGAATPPFGGRGSLASNELRRWGRPLR
jgi:hypothetical protein